MIEAAHILYKLCGVRRRAVRKIYGTDSRHNSWLYLFLGGFLAGILWINICRNTLFQDMELLNASSLNRLRYLDIDGGTFFLYVMRERMGVVVLMCLLAMTFLGTAAVAAYAFWMGTMAGVFLSVASIRYGLKGIVLIIVGIVPHYFLLVPACIMLMNWCYKLSTALYYPERAVEALYGSRKQYLIRKIPQLLIIIGVVIIGSLLESYVNPTMLSYFLKIF